MNNKVILIAAAACLCFTTVNADTKLHKKTNFSYVGKPVKHGDIRSQGDLSVCWAEVTASYFDNKILNETGTKVDVSADYFTRNMIFTQMMGALPAVKKLADEQKNDPSPTEASKTDRLKKIAEMAEKMDLGSRPFFPGGMSMGAVPSSVYEKASPDFYKKGSPVHSVDKIKNMLTVYFTSNPDKTRRELFAPILESVDNMMNGKFLLPDVDFNYEGQNYSPRKFLSDYLKFQPQSNSLPLVEVYATDGKRDGAFEADLKVITHNLDKGYAVPIGVQLLDDVENANYDIDSIGVFDYKKCIHGKDACKIIGGHALLVVNTIKDSKGKVTAFIVQNSWGKKGRNIYGKRTSNIDSKGFYILPIDYLLKAAKIFPTQLALYYYPTILGKSNTPAKNKPLELPSNGGSVRVINFDKKEGESCSLSRFSVSTYVDTSKPGIKDLSSCTNAAVFFQTSDPSCTAEYGIVQYVKGCSYNVSYKTGSKTPSDFEPLPRILRNDRATVVYPNWQIDSNELDPMFESSKGEGMRQSLYRITDRTVLLRADKASMETDYKIFFGKGNQPLWGAQANSAKPSHMFVREWPDGGIAIPAANGLKVVNTSLKYKTCIYHIKDIPLKGDPKGIDATEAEGGPIACIDWDNMYNYNPDTNKIDQDAFHGEIDPKCSELK